MVLRSLLDATVARIDHHRRHWQSNRGKLSSYGSSDSIPVAVVVTSVVVVLFYHAEGGGSGQDRTTPSWIVADVVTGAEVRRISIGFEPEIGGRPKTAWLFHDKFRWSSAVSSAFFNDLFNLSTSRLWNLFRELELPVFGGDEPVLLLGLCNELWDALEDVLEKCREVRGTERWAGDVRKSDPGEVDNDGPSDFEHSETCEQNESFLNSILSSHGNR